MSKDLCFIVVILYIVASPSLSGEPARLINGSVVSGTDYTEVVMLSADADAGRLRCSATVVGPRVVATAAHCAPRGATLHFRRGDTVYSGTFRASPRYTKPFLRRTGKAGKSTISRSS